MTNYITNYVSVGTPNIDANYIYTTSGDNISAAPTNFIKMNKIFAVGNYSWVFKTKLQELSYSGDVWHYILGYCGDDGSAHRFNNVYFTIQDNKLMELDISYNGTSWAEETVGTHEYVGNEYIKLSFNGTQYKVEYSTDDENYITDITINSSTPIYTSGENDTGIGVYVGYGNNSHYLNGSLDLKETKLYINNELYWEAVTEISYTGTHIQLRHDTSTAWALVNPTLLVGEVGVETNTGKFKIGDGSTPWNSLAYASGGGGSVPIRKTITQASANISESSGTVTVTDADVTTSTMVTLYPSDTDTETWLANNLASNIITEGSGSFTFTINGTLPATFSMYYIIQEVD